MPGFGVGRSGIEGPAVILGEVGLDVGDVVRFRRREGGRWRTGVVTGLERDGSLGLRDENGASRAIRLDEVEARTVGPKGGATWEAVSSRLGRGQQLGLF